MGDKTRYGANEVFTSYVRLAQLAGKQIGGVCDHGKGDELPSIQEDIWYLVYFPLERGWRIVEGNLTLPLGGEIRTSKNFVQAADLTINFVEKYFRVTTILKGDKSDN
jgi:hypothetical protein